MTKEMAGIEVEATPGTGPIPGAKSASVSMTLTREVLLQEAWQSYLAAKTDGSATQRTSALKAVCDHLGAIENARSSDELPGSALAKLTDEQLKARVLSLLTLHAETLGVEIKRVED